MNITGRNTKRGRFVAALTASAMLVTSGVALADNVVNNVTTSDETVAIISGGYTTVGYKINQQPFSQDGQAGCNAEDGTPAIVTITAPSAVAVSSTDPQWNPTTKALTFSNCTGHKYVTFESSTAGIHDITHSISDAAVGGGIYNNQANWSLKVTPRSPGTVGATAGNAQVGLSWVASQDAPSIDGYKVYRDSGTTPVATVTGISTTVAGLTNGTSYCFTVKAYKGTLESAGSSACATPAAPADETPPTVDISLNPTVPDGDAPWYKSNVSVSVSATDNESAVTSTEIKINSGSWTAYTGAVTISTEGTNTVNARATSVGGTGDANEVTVKLDGTAPTVSLTSPGHSTAGTATTASNIALSATGTDATSGLAWVRATNAAMTPAASVTLVKATSTNDHTGSLALACGANTISVTGRDNAGNQATTTAVTVHRNCWTVEILEPLTSSTAANKVANTVKNGRVVPFKVKVSYAGTEVTEGIAPAFMSGTTTCSGASPDTVDTTVADAGQSSGETNAFRWSTDGFWVYNVDTTALKMVANTCYRLDVRVAGYQATAVAFAILQPKK